MKTKAIVVMLLIGRRPAPMRVLRGPIREKQYHRMRAVTGL